MRNENQDIYREDAKDARKALISGFKAFCNPLRSSRLGGLNLSCIGFTGLGT
jgi:hypothetical protein